MSSGTVLDLSSGRFLEPSEVAAIFRRSVRWVYDNAQPAKGPPEKGGRKAGFLFPARRLFNAKTLLFDRVEIERIIAAAGEPGEI